ncbi:FAD-binding monooxygenase [Neoconidiobolus thromboides FSU 785]|nr:FAD-binding monooxygenase [Neoconidiobolus thromboides FSU 785]
MSEQNQINNNNKVDLESEVDVLIAGAGPVGLVMANLLARDNISFKIIEKKTEIYPYSRAFAIHSRTQEIFDQLEVIDTIKKEGKSGPFYSHIYKNGEKIFELKLPLSHSPHPTVVGLIQSETERILAEKVIEVGHEVHNGVELEQLEWNDEKKVFESAIVKHLKDSKKERIKFKYVIGCDGARSVVRKIANIKFTGESVNIQLTCIDAMVNTDFTQEPFAFFDR